MTVSSYYKSRFLADPVIYVQDEGKWRSYALGGVIRESVGAIPEHMLRQIEPVGEQDALDLIQERLEEAERIKVEDEAYARLDDVIVRDDVDGQRRLWGLIPLWALIPLAAGVVVDLVGSAYGIYWLHGLGAAIFFGTWFKARPATQQAGRPRGLFRKKSGPAQ